MSESTSEVRSTGVSVVDQPPEQYREEFEQAWAFEQGSTTHGHSLGVLAGGEPRRRRRHVRPSDVRQTRGSGVGARARALCVRLVAELSMYAFGRKHISLCAWADAKTGPMTIPIRTCIFPARFHGNERSSSGHVR